MSVILSTANHHPFKDVNYADINCIATMPNDENSKADATRDYYQATLAGAIECQGVGVHSAREVKLIIEPAAINTGYVFIRTDLNDKNIITGLFTQVVDTQMCTKIANKDGVSVATIEHLLAALAGAKITNAIIKVNGPEIPIMDGSSAVFANLIEKVGVTLQNTLVAKIKVSKGIKVINGNAYAEFIPSKQRKINMQFDGRGRLGPLLVSSEYSFSWDRDNFKELLSGARTFGFYEDAQKLQQMGLAKGVSLENTIVIQPDYTLMNTGGLRYPDELIRHKVLDAIGDLALAGLYIEGCFRGYNSGHTLNNQLLWALFKQEGLLNQNPCF